MIDPGQSAQGMVLLHFPVTQDVWDHRRTAILNVDLYHQGQQSVLIGRASEAIPNPRNPEPPNDANNSPNSRDMTRRRWIADTWTATTATLTGDQAAHLARVLRAEPGQIYDVVANGFLHRAEITSVSEAEVLFTLHEELESDAALPLHLLLAVFKFDHMEWAIEKATELGIARITPSSPAAPKNTSPNPPSSAPNAGAASPSKPPSNPAAPTSPKSPTPSPSSKPSQPKPPPPASSSAKPSKPSLSPPPSNAATSIAATANRHTALAIGPEGGWTPEEMSLFTQHNGSPSPSAPASSAPKPPPSPPSPSPPPTLITSQTLVPTFGTFPRPKQANTAIRSSSTHLSTASTHLSSVSSRLSIVSS